MLLVMTGCRSFHDLMLLPCWGRKMFDFKCAGIGQDVVLREIRVEYS